MLGNNSSQDSEPADSVAAVGSDSSPQVSCDVCQRVCANLRGLQIHRRAAHPEEYMAEVAERVAAKKPRKHAKVEDSVSPYYMTLSISFHSIKVNIQSPF